MERSREHLVLADSELEATQRFLGPESTEEREIDMVSCSRLRGAVWTCCAGEAAGRRGVSGEECSRRTLRDKEACNGAA